MGRTVIAGGGCPELRARLEARGFRPREAPCDEFAKAGGGPKCLTLRLDGQ